MADAFEDYFANFAKEAKPEIAPGVGAVRFENISPEDETALRKKLGIEKPAAAAPAKQPSLDQFEAYFSKAKAATAKPGLLEKAGTGAIKGAQEALRVMTPDYEAAGKSIQKFPEESARLTETLRPVFGRSAEALAPVVTAGRTAMSAPASLLPKGVNEALEPIVKGGSWFLEESAKMVVPPFLRKSYEGSGAEKLVKEFAPDAATMATLGLGAKVMNPKALPIERAGAAEARTIKPTIAEKIPSVEDAKAAMGVKPEAKPAKPTMTEAAKAKVKPAAKLSQEEIQAKIAANEAQIEKIKAEAAKAETPPASDVREVRPGVSKTFKPAAETETGILSENTRPATNAPVMAFKRADGEVVYDVGSTVHPQAMEKLTQLGQLEAEGPKSMKESGFVVDGKFTTDRSAAANAADKVRAQQVDAEAGAKARLAEKKAAQTKPPEAVLQPEGAPAFISKARKQELLDLGYTREAVSKMKPAEAQEILTSRAAPSAMAPRTPEEMAREDQTTKVLREGAATQKPVGVPKGPMTAEQTAMQGRARPVTKPVEAAAATEAKPAALTPAIRVDGEVKYKGKQGDTSHIGLADLTAEHFAQNKLNPNANIEMGWVDDSGKFMDNQEAAAARSGTPLYSGIPLPEIKQFVNKFIVEPMAKWRESARTLYSPRNVNVESRTAQDLLTRRTSRIEEAERQVSNLTRYGKAIMEMKPESEQIDFWHNLESGKKQSHPIEQKISDLLRYLLDQNRDELVDRGLLKKVIDDYAPHQFDNPQVAQQVMAQMQSNAANKNLKGPNYFLKQRTLTGTVRDVLNSPEGIQAGLKLRYPNPVTAVERLLADSSRLIHGHDLLKEELQPKGFVKLIRDPKDIPPEWREVEGYKPPRRPVTDAARPDAAAVYVPSGKYYAPAPIARILNNYTRPGLLSGDRAYVKPLQAFREATGVANLLNLGMSTFHVLTTAQGSLANEFKRGIMSVKEGDFIGAGKRFAIGATHLGPFVRDVVYGKQLERISNDPRMAVHFPEASKLIKQYIDEGGRIEQSRPFFSRYVNDYLKTLEDRSIVEGGDAKLAKTLKTVLTLGTEGVFKHAVGPAKLAAFAERFNDFAQHNPGLDDAQMLKHGSLIMDQIEDAFGAVNYDRWGIDRHIRDTMFIGLRAVGWTVGNLKILGGGLEDLARGRITERSATMLGQLGAAMFTGTLINLAFTGKLPEVNVSDPMKSLYNIFNPEVGGVNPDGTPTRTGFAGIHRDWAALLYNVAKPIAQGDPMSAVQGATKFALGKESPILSLGTKLATNQDYFGRPIVDKAKGAMGQAGDFVESVGKELLPFSLSNVMSERRQGVDRPLWQSGAIALTPPTSTRATETKFMRLLGETMPRGNIASAAQEQHIEYKKELYEKLAKGEKIDSLIRAGSINASDVKEALKRLAIRKQPNGVLISALNHPGVSVDTLSSLAEATTKEEAPIVLQHLNMKMANAAHSGRLTQARVDAYKKAKAVLQSKIGEPPAPNMLPSPMEASQ